MRRCSTARSASSFANLIAQYGFDIDDRSAIRRLQVINANPIPGNFNHGNPV